MRPRGGPFGSLGGVPPRLSSGPFRGAEGALGAGPDAQQPMGRAQRARGGGAFGAGGRSGCGRVRAGPGQRGWSEGGSCGRSRSRSRSRGLEKQSRQERGAQSARRRAAAQVRDAPQRLGLRGVWGWGGRTRGACWQPGPRPFRPRPRSAPMGSLWGRVARARTSCS